MHLIKGYNLINLFRKIKNLIGSLKGVVKSNVPIGKSWHPKIKLKNKN